MRTAAKLAQEKIPVLFSCILFFTLVCGVLGFAGQGFSQAAAPLNGANALSADTHQTATLAVEAGIGRQESSGGDDQAPQPTLSQKIHRQIASIQASFTKLERGADTFVQGFHRLPEDLGVAFNTLSEGKGLPFAVFTLLKVLLIYGAALAVEFFARRATAAVRRYLEQAEFDYFLYKLLRNGLLLLLEGLYFAIFFYSAMVLIALTLADGSTTRMIASGYLAPIYRARMLVLIFSFLFSPNSSSARITPITDYAAKVFFYYFSGAVIVTLLIARTLFSMLALGISDETFLFLFFFETWPGLFLLLHMVFSNKKILTDHITKHSVSAKESPVTAWIYTRWYILITVYLVGMVIIRDVNILLGNYSVDAFALSIASVPAAILLEMLVWSLLNAAFPASSAAPEDVVMANQDDPEATSDQGTPKPRQASRMAIQMFSTVRVFILLGLMLFLLDIWGVEFAFSRGVVGAVFSVSIAVSIAYFAWEYVSMLIDRHMDVQGDAAEEMEEGGKGGSRKDTLLVLLKKFIVIAISTITIFVILSAIGIDTGPLLAGAGILGLAVGFGAQTLVRDIFSGVFYLIDDAFRIGDFVESGAHKGTVEQISIRTLRLRHVSGSVITIPYGDLGTVTNFSRDYVLMKLDFRVPPETDIEKVRKIIKKIGKRFLEDPEHGPKFLEPLKSQGVKMIDDDSALVVRMKFKTTPGEQFVLRREIFRALQEDFAANGIQFAPRKVAVHIPENLLGDGTKPTNREVVKAAITGAVTAEMEKERQEKK